MMVDSRVCLPAVDVRNAEKSYGIKSSTNVIFTKLNLNVPLGFIYGLLGPSGCGKTSLLRCILGRLNLDKGSILVFGHPPGSKESGVPGPTVGYMAQEPTVYLTMTIGEFLHYFGTILGMSRNQIQQKIDYFIKLLRLPSKNTLTCKLSGGQLRRVQFAAALIHDPKLLILDEPTVGIDPITKQSMWDHLVNLTKNNNTSIILTTHYIEEARLAHRVGMIHGCTMAAEDSTENLLRKYNKDTLEEVFLQICYQDLTAVVANNNEQSDFEPCSDLCESANIPKVESDENLPKSSSFKTYLRGCNVAWHRLYAVIIRNFINLYRFPGVLLLLALLPVSQVLMYTHTMGSPIGGIQMIIINDDIGQLGSHYLSYLSPEVIIQKHFTKYDVGFRALKEGESHGILHIRANFSAVVHKRFADFALASDELVKAGTIDVQMDNTNLNIAKFAEFHLLDKFQHFVYDSLSVAGINPFIGNLPINVSQETVTALTRPANIFVLPGELVLASYFCALPVALLGLFLEKCKGYLEPNLIAGLTSAEILLGIILVQLGLLVIQNIGIILAALPVLNSINRGSIFLIFCLIYIQGLGGTSLGIFLSLLCDNPITLFSAVSIFIFSSAAISGIFWPVESMPLVFRYICWAFPFSQPVRAIQVIIHRGWGLYSFNVLSAFGTSFLWMVIYLGLSLILLHVKK